MTTRRDVLRSFALLCVVLLLLPREWAEKLAERWAADRRSFDEDLRRAAAGTLVVFALARERGLVALRDMRAPLRASDYRFLAGDTWNFERGMRVVVST